jgi:putative nucleotidyltransferase with HDIG domain
MGGAMTREEVKKIMRDNKVPEDTIIHGELVCDLALKVASRIEEQEGVQLDHDSMIEAAILHDIGFTRCTGEPVEVLILGKRNYTLPADVTYHVIHGADIAKELGFSEEVQHIVLRHEIIPVTREERSELGILPLPQVDTIPVTWEEKAVMYGDGLAFLALGLDLDLWNDPQAPAEGFLDVLKVHIGHLVKEPITLSHPVLERANRLNAELKGYFDPAWVAQFK